MDEELRNIAKEDHALYKKGRDIYETAWKICELIPEDNEHLREIGRFIMEDAAKLSVKIAGVSKIGLYDMKMEAAAIIRKAANDLMVQNHSLEAFGFKEHEYFQVVRDLIEEYRLLFIEWVSRFDQWDYIIDRWGLFNPPGVGPFDHDPDDDIPFNPDDFLNFEDPDE